jgi:UDP-N-acetylmuramoylalanine--D-glutamate ligase
MNVIVGLGKTGLSCVRYCLRRRLPFAVTDSRENPPGLDELNAIAPQATKVLGEVSRELIQQASCLIVSPGISLLYTPVAEARARGIPVIGDIELFMQEVKIPVVGITGSNAKTTVTTLVGEMAEKSGKKVMVAGNIGTPVLDVLEGADAELYVLELSSFQLERTPSIKLAVATVLNICEDHMDRHVDMEEYIDS